MKFEIAALIVLAVVAYIIWSFYQQNRTTNRERTELDNLRTFKDRVRDHVLTQTQLDPNDPFAQLLFIEIQDLDRANASNKELS